MLCSIKTHMTSQHVICRVARLHPWHTNYHQLGTSSVLLYYILYYTPQVRISASLSPPDHIDHKPPWLEYIGIQVLLHFKWCAIICNNNRWLLELSVDFVNFMFKILYFLKFIQIFSVPVWCMYDYTWLYFSYTACNVPIYCGLDTDITFNFTIT